MRHPLAVSTILGLNAYHGDAAAAVMRNGVVIAAAAEERFSRQKHDAGFPHRAAAWCVASAEEVREVAIGRDPRSHRVRKALALARHPSLLRHAGERLRNGAALRGIEREVEELLGRSVPIRYVEHHRAHLTHAYITSPFERCAVLSLDGFGDFVSAAWGRAEGNEVHIRKRIFFPHSLGLLYTAISQFLGFDRYGEEYKVMALASYGTPRHRDAMRRLIRPTLTGFCLATSYFEHIGRGIMMSFGSGTPVIGRAYHSRLHTLLGEPRERDAPLTARHTDIAASLQAVTEEILLHVGRIVRKETGERFLAFAGGVALNSVANGVLRRARIFEDIWVPSAPADDGTAIGAAAAVSLTLGERAMPSKRNGSPFLGPAPDAAPPEVPNGANREVVSSMDALLERAVDVLDRGGIVGWFHGRMEFGPRALGHRSILADPRRSDMRDRLNAQVKHREAFRPFAPIVLTDDADTFFERPGHSPTMMFVAPVRTEWRARLPAITHVDGSARIQTIDESVDERTARLLRRWEERTGISVLVNTSFNENEPIVCSVDEAVGCFERTAMDALIVGDALFTKPSAITNRAPVTTSRVLSAT